MTRRLHSGTLASGSRYAVEVPERWNGVLVLWSRPVPVAAGVPPWAEDPLVHQLADAGYAVAGSANTVFWPVEAAFAEQPVLLDLAASLLGPIRHTVAFGMSIGGLITAGLVQRFPSRLSGALAMCANLAGAVAVHNTELDIGFVFKTLLAADSGLQLVGITDPYANLELATTLLDRAQSTAVGRARLGLAAAVGNVPGWHDPTSPPPAREDFGARQANQYAWFRQMSFLVYYWAREQVERQAGGNPSWNSSVDYGELLATSTNRDEVEALYEEASLDLGVDLARLADESRIAADPAAVGYLERHVVFSGDLGGVPVLTVHTDGDGLVTPDNQWAYADVVSHAGHRDLLGQVYVHRAGHCTFTFAEILTALDVLVERIDSGTWPLLDPEALNTAAAALGPDANTLPSGASMTAGFFDFEPPRFRRRYDGRDLGSESGPG